MAKTLGIFLAVKKNSKRKKGKNEEAPTSSDKLLEKSEPRSPKGVGKKPGEEKVKKEAVKETVKEKSSEEAYSIFNQNQKILLKEPVVSEKARDLSTEGKYVFKVSGRANKNSIKKEVERRWEVSVESVNIIVVEKRAKRFAGRPGRVSKFKKAIVTLEPNQKIDIYPV